jgi:hypothetical protein
MVRIRREIFRRLFFESPGFSEKPRVGDTKARADLLWRAESDSAFYAELGDWCERLKPRFEPARERESWRALLADVASKA